MGDRGDIKRSQLENVVFVIAHNRGELTDEVQAAIRAYELTTYRRLLEAGLARKRIAVSEGLVGGGAEPISWYEKALAHLEHILSDGKSDQGADTVIP